ncbi:class F sortase [Actinoplanes sp. LDG1-06]|uniref:Class F sortase n=2 Tax=Paractinoplanes ovalisporus TaxID=2810368 RepID=A0ABS2AD10_9ACTN|nr:class F sortase [Actinoplanes ovalisporus]
MTDRVPADLGRWAGITAGATATSATTTGATKAATKNGTAERPAGDPFGSIAAAPTGAPTRLRVGAIKIDTPLETLKIGPDGALQPPKKFALAGWYADGTAPGDNGPAVIAGHVDSREGPAVFYRLRDLTTGDRIDVVRGGATLSFTVTAIRWYPKTEFPTEEVYGPTPDRQLRLITCGGVFDRTLRSYRDNLVVYAVAG